MSTISKLLLNLDILHFEFVSQGDREGVERGEPGCRENRLRLAEEEPFQLGPEVAAHERVDDRVDGRVAKVEVNNVEVVVEEQRASGQNRRQVADNEHDRDDEEHEGGACLLDQDEKGNGFGVYGGVAAKEARRLASRVLARRALAAQCCLLPAVLLLVLFLVVGDVGATLGRDVEIGGEHGVGERETGGRHGRARGDLAG